MDQRDLSKKKPQVQFLVYEGGELAAGYVCGLIVVEIYEIDVIDEIKEGSYPRISKDMLGRGRGEYVGRFYPRPSHEDLLVSMADYPCHSGIAWVVAAMLEQLHQLQPARGPYQAIPCSPQPGHDNPSK